MIFFLFRCTVDHGNSLISRVHDVQTKLNHILSACDSVGIVVLPSPISVSIDQSSRCLQNIDLSSRIMCVEIRVADCTIIAVCLSLLWRWLSWLVLPVVAFFSTIHLDNVQRDTGIAAQ